MAVLIEAKDVPRENLFRVGIRQEVTTRDLYVIAQPRRPFIINRAEALNLIGHLVCKADLTVADLEESIRIWKPELNIFDVKGDDRRVIISPATKARIFHPTQTDFQRDALLASAEMGLYLFGIEEGKILCAALVHIMALRPKEVDVGVVAIFDHARDPSGAGESEQDLRG